MFSQGADDAAPGPLAETQCGTAQSLPLSAGVNPGPADERGTWSLLFSHREGLKEVSCHFAFWANASWSFLGT